MNIAKELYDAGVQILGTSPESIHLAEDRQKFKQIIQQLDIPQPESGVARSVEEALAVVEKIGYPLMVRPSFVLGGRGMQVVHNKKMFLDYVKTAIEVSPEYPMLIDKFLEQAIEVEVDAVADGEDVYIPTVMEHIELAGIHSGDSACVIPARNISKENLAVIEDHTKEIAKALKVIGLMNIQYAIAGGKVYILEANPRASRTVPVVSKVMGISMAKIATQVMLGKKLNAIIPAKKKDLSHVGVKEAVFPFNMFPAVDPILGPEMRATGEVMGIASSFGLAFYKAQEAAGMKLPLEGTVLISVADEDKGEIVEVANRLSKLSFKVLATKGTKGFLKKTGIKCELALKLYEGRPNIIDDILNKRIQMIINTPVGRESKYDDSYIRRAAIQHRIPYITTIAAAKATVEGMETAKCGGIEIRSIQEYHTRSIR